MSSRRKDIAREASHAGSWYTDSGETSCELGHFGVIFNLNSGRELSDQLDLWLREAGTSTHGPARAIIAP